MCWIPILYRNTRFTGLSQALEEYGVPITAMSLIFPLSTSAHTILCASEDATSIVGLLLGSPCSIFGLKDAIGTETATSRESCGAY